MKFHGLTRGSYRIRLPPSVTKAARFGVRHDGCGVNQGPSPEGSAERMVATESVGQRSVFFMLSVAEDFDPPRVRPDDVEGI